MLRLTVLFLAAIPLTAADLREEAASALRQAVEFFRTEVSTNGGYHFQYADDLSFGRSEHAQGPTQVSIQRAGTPRVGMAYLEAWEATGDRYYLEAARDSAHALVRGQLCNGGWDYIIEFDPAKRALYPYRADENCDRPPSRPTTLDDNVTQAALRLLIRTDRELEFQDKAIHEAAEAGLDSLLRAQYPNGAWPQRYAEFPDPAEFPVKKASYPESWSREWPDVDYRSHYTLNDNTLADVIDTMLEAARIYDEPRYLYAARRGGDFLLLAQMPDPQPAWAQQYDRDMHPAWARQFEPPSITGGESQSALRILLTLYRETGDEKYLEPIPRALAYLKSSGLPHDPNASARKLRSCPLGTLCLPRFLELKTNRGLFISRGTMIRVADGPSQRPDGYDVTYDDSHTITHYGMWASGRPLEAIEAEYNRLREASPESVRRPAKLSGLSPWQQMGSGQSRGDRRPEPTEAEVRSLLASRDDRGIWVQDGVAGRADLVASVYAAEPMVVRIDGKTIPLPDDAKVEVFRGAAPVVEKMIVSSTFAEHIEQLAAFLR